MRVALRLCVTLLLLCAGTVGCGSETKPATWARSVCNALTPWRTEITNLTTNAQQQMSATKSAEQTKTNMVGLLGGAEQASETARKAVAAAGVPDVDQGAEIARRFTDSLSKARDAYGHAKTTIAALPTANAGKFYDGVTAAFTTLNTEYAASALDTSHVGSADLQRAFDEVPECR